MCSDAESELAEVEAQATGPRAQGFGDFIKCVDFPRLVAAVRELIAGKKVVVIEDSIIRGTTTKTRCRAMKEAGAKEVHMLVSCPPHRYPCYYGIDFSSKGELIACDNSIETIRDYIGLDSLHYLSLEGLIEATRVEKEWFCLACFNGEYPVGPIDEFASKSCLEVGR